MNKKKMMIAASALALGISFLAGGAVMAAPAANNYIGSERAKEIALTDARLSASDATVVRAKLDYDDGRAEYEVEFYQGNMEYDYEIDAVTGAILSYDYDAEYISQNTTKAAAGVSGQGTESDFISAESAIQIALEHAGVAQSDTRRMETDFDYEWGMAVYEVEWKVGWTEYSYEINASTGEVLGYEIEQD